MIRIGSAFLSIIHAAVFLALCFMYTGCTKHHDPADDSTPNQGSVHIDTLGRVILGAPTSNSVALKLLFDQNTICKIKYSKDSANLLSESPDQPFTGDIPGDVVLEGLSPDTRYYYRLSYKTGNSNATVESEVYSFYTCRSSGSTFSFGIQGDSHPERAGKMFDAELYKLNMRNVAATGVDLYFAMGDDFSIERLIESNTATQENVDKVYASHRKYLGMACSNASLFLVNGNHEQAALYLFDGTDSNPALHAGVAKKKFYPLPYPDQFYMGNITPLDHIGFLGNYYSFTWGDALFVAIDPYWHTPVKIGGGKKDSYAGGGDLWDVTLGREQYEWLKKTLETSNAKYKFVFEHHILGTGRGGIEMATLDEWGGYNGSGTWEFDKYRPGWEEPIHQLMVRTGVTIFFQGHDHIYCKQELDGVIYQSVPNPADPTYTAFNASDYQSGIILPNSGFLNVTVSANNVKVEYISAVLPADETTGHRNGTVCYSYTIQK